MGSLTESVTVDAALARIYMGPVEYTYVGGAEPAWEVDDGERVGRMATADVIRAVGRSAVRLAIMEVDPDERARMTAYLARARGAS